jgi:anti-sigma regulatory factor (Ser/Thr protein kinase)
VSISIRDEGQGFDINKVQDPTSQENIQSSYGRGVYLMKALMHEVRFEEGGILVRMRKRRSANRDTQLVKQLDSTQASKMDVPRKTD